MSNKERGEMTNNIDIDFDAIPHPKDCHPVPDGAVLPAGTPCWVVHKSGAASWLPSGYRSTSAIYDGGAVHLTPHPIISCPTPDDSPIIIEGINGEPVSAETLAMWAPKHEMWITTSRDRCHRWLKSDEITKWSPTVVTTTEPGVWDERDKRARINKRGEPVTWLEDVDVWLVDKNRKSAYGSLAAMRRWRGERYLVGFADEQGGEE